MSNENVAAAPAGNIVGRTLYGVEGQHWEVPGVRLSIHATREGADARALELMNLLLADCDQKPADTCKDAQARLAKTLESRGHSADLVTVFPLAVEG